MSDNGIPMQPGLDQFRGAFTTPESKSWANDQAVRVNDYVTQKALVQNQEQAADNATANVQQYGSNLVNAVSRDPQFVHTALSLVPHHIGELVSNNPHIPDEQRQETHDAITKDLQNQIAISAVRSMAGQDGEAAKQLLNHENLSPVLSDQDKESLGHYIDLQTIARGADQAAQARLQLDRSAINETSAAIGHASQLYDPSIDHRQLPTGWAQNVVADTNLSAPARADLLNLYGRIQTHGDAPASDPFLVANTVRDAAQGRSVPIHNLFQSAGNNLRLGDALWLAKNAMPKTLQDKDYLNQVHAHIEAAKQQYLPNGPSDLAGQSSFGEFMKWFMPRVRANSLDLNPNSKDYFGGNEPAQMWNKFRGSSVTPQASENRPSLQQIFGGSK